MKYNRVGSIWNLGSEMKGKIMINGKAFPIKLEPVADGMLPRPSFRVFMGNKPLHLDAQVMNSYETK